ncbi:MAG TPA: hypothetical protein PKC89_06105, partial [Pyrinomonadaceae bacterium]|nr:hypothetical protein [Pyrinomonadaceae bacterium]
MFVERPYPIIPGGGLPLRSAVGLARPMRITAYYGGGLPPTSLRRVLRTLQHYLGTVTQGCGRGGLT